MTTHGRRPLWSLLSWIAGLIVVIAVLHRLAALDGRYRLPTVGEAVAWVESVGPAVAVVALVRVAAMALAVYLLALTLASLLLRLVRWEGAATTVERFAPRMVARLVRSAVGLSIVAGSLTVPAAGAVDASSDSPVVTMRLVSPTTTLRPDPGPASTTTPEVAPDHGAATAGTGPDVPPRLRRLNPPTTTTLRPDPGPSTTTPEVAPDHGAATAGTGADEPPRLRRLTPPTTTTTSAAAEPAAAEASLAPPTLRGAADPADESQVAPPTSRGAALPAAAHAADESRAEPPTLRRLADPIVDSAEAPVADPSAVAEEPRVAPPTLRRLGDPADAEESPAARPPTPPAADQPNAPAEQTPTARPTTTPPRAATAAAEKSPAAPPTLRRLGEPAPEAAPPTAAEYVVRPGDHLWAIAEQALTEAWGRAPSDRELDPYWRTLIEQNRQRLHDPANPDLLFPGDRLTVPAAPAPAGT